MITLEEADKLIKETLSEKRYNHSICVMERCAEYARDFGVDEDLAKLMGILHDVAKEMPKEEKVEYCKKNNLEINEVEAKHITLLHGKIAAHMCKTMFDMPDNLCDAIEYHTTGRRNMTIWDKILYVADTTSSDRKYDNTEKIYKLSKENFNESVIECLMFTIQDRLEQRKMIHIESINALNDLLSKEYE